MGLFEKLRAELIDIVEWVDDSHAALVWRFPRYHNQIKHGAQLIVRPGQTAVFVHQGKIADVFGPGRYSLETKNLPVLATLAGCYDGRLVQGLELTCSPGVARLCPAGHSCSRFGRCDSADPAI